MKEFFPKEREFRLSGRTVIRDEVLYLSHAASFMEFMFEGKKLEIMLESEGGDEEFQAWIGIFIDGAEHSEQRIALEKGCKWYPVWESDNKHRICIRIVKMSENQYAYAAIKKIRTDKDAIMSATPSRKKRIEFIGDSITCGFGNEGRAGDGFLTGTENPLKAYAVLTADKLGCEYTLIAWSGIGIISSWVEPECEEPNTEVLVPDVYPYMDYSLYSRLGWMPIEKYSFETDDCDLIVVNLGTNDASYTRDHEDRKEVFKQAYQRFLRYLTGTHRGKPIVCVTNAMTDLLGYEIDEAIKAVRAEENAPLYLMRFSDNEEGDGEGAVGHPSLIRHEKMAVQLSDWIRKKVIF